MALTNTQATELLKTLLERKGILRVITSEVDPKHRTDVKDARSPAKEGVDLRDPATMVIHDIVRIEAHPVRKTHLVAYTAEGDEVESYDGPQALLVRLIEWNYYDANNPGSTKSKAEAVAEAMYSGLRSEEDK